MIEPTFIATATATAGSISIPLIMLLGQVDPEYGKLGVAGVLVITFAGLFARTFSLLMEHHSKMITMQDVHAKSLQDIQDRHSQKMQEMQEEHAETMRAILTEHTAAFAKTVDVVAKNTAVMERLERRSP